MTANARRRILALAVLATGTCLLTGCYERVVGASGFGADGVTVTRPNGPATKSSKTYTYKKTTVKEIPAPGAPE